MKLHDRLFAAAAVASPAGRRRRTWPPLPPQPRRSWCRGTVPDEASKAALLARLRALYGAERVVDQLAVGRVAAPPELERARRRADRPEPEADQPRPAAGRRQQRQPARRRRQRSRSASSIASELAAQPRHQLHRQQRLAGGGVGAGHAGRRAGQPHHRVRIRQGDPDRFRQGHPGPDERGAAAPEGQEGGGDRPHRQRRLARRQPLAEPGARRGGAKPTSPAVASSRTWSPCPAKARIARWPTTARRKAAPATAASSSRWFSKVQHTSNRVSRPIRGQYVASMSKDRSSDPVCCLRQHRFRAG